MTHVTFFRTGKHLYGFDCTGHAGYAEAGEDIVCSAISVLTQTAVIGLTEVAHLPADVSVTDGHLCCVVSRDMDDPQQEEADLLLNTLLKGLHAVDESYPGYLKIRE